MFLMQGLVLVQLLAWVIAGAISDSQRCYYDAHQLAPNYIIPCYESAIDKYSPCCKQGSVCLEDDACYDAETGNTYQYGCTDATYTDTHCPEKCNLDRAKSNWVGLVYCDGADDNTNNTWLCHHPDNCGDRCPLQTPWDPALSKLPDVTCEDLDSNCKAFSAGPTLQNILQLPSDSTRLASYFAAHSTTAPVDSAAATVFSNVTAYASQSMTTVTATAFATTSVSNAPNSDPWSSQNNPTVLGASLGIGIPVAVGIFGLLALHLRQRRRSNAKDAGHKGAIGDLANGNSSNDNFGHKAELPGSSVMAEIEGSAIEEQTPLPSPVESPRSAEFGKRRITNITVVSGLSDWEASQQSPVSESCAREVYELPG